MTKVIPGILARIVDHKALELRDSKVAVQELENRAADAVKTRRNFAAGLRGRRPAIIAEIKKASPSKGLLAADFQPAATAAEYELGGAAALSVLTDAEFFQGSLDHLETARDAVRLPVLRKDFTIDEYHIVEAAAHNADAILLIAAILPQPRLRALRELADSYQLASLVEVHDIEELASALDSGAEIIGVNNRDLNTFQVTLNTSLHLADRIPASILKVSESGFSTRAQITQLQDAGYDAFLIGEHLMRSANASAALKELTA